MTWYIKFLPSFCSNQTFHDPYSWAADNHNAGMEWIPIDSHKHAISVMLSLDLSHAFVTSNEQNLFAYLGNKLPSDGVKNTPRLQNGWFLTYSTWTCRTLWRHFWSEFGSDFSKFNWQKPLSEFNMKNSNFNNYFSKTYSNSWTPLGTSITVVDSHSSNSSIPRETSNSNDISVFTSLLAIYIFVTCINLKEDMSEVLCTK